MALPSSGAITLSDVNTNIGASSTAAITMNDTAVRLLSNGDTTTNPVTMNGLYGKSWVWATNYSGGSTSTANSVAVDSSGNVYASQLGLVVSKTNPVGIMQWAIQLTGTSGYTAANTTNRNSIVVASSGNVYCAVRVFSNTSPFPYYFGVVKLNSSGSIQWSSFLSSPSSYVTNMSIGIDSSENVYVTNYNVTGDATATNNGMCVAKYNSSGSLQWQKRLQLVYANGGSSPLVVDATNNYVYLSGLVYDSSFNQLGGLLGKYDTSLSPVWQSLLSSSLRSYYGCAVNPTTQTVCGITDDASIVSYNSSGSVQWYRKTSSGAGIFYSIALDSSDNTYFGFKSSSNTGIYLKANSSGTLSSQIQVAATTISVNNIAPVTASGSYMYSAINTSVAVAGVFDGITVFKIPSAMTTSGTYGRVTFSAPSYTFSTPTLSFTSASTTIVSTSFTEISGVLSGSNIASSYTKTISAI